MSTGTYQVTVERSMDVPVERAYRAWAEANEVSTWFTTSARQDFRVGGHYDNGDGDKGEYLAIEPNRHIRFTWENADHWPGTLVDVWFEPQGENASLVRVTHSTLPSADAIPGFNDGWSWALDSMKSYLETGKAIRYAEWEAMKKVSI